MTEIKEMIESISVAGTVSEDYMTLFPSPFRV
jgi:hypothetical protein